MATSKSVYEDVQFLCNKYHHGYITPAEFMNSFNTAQRIYINRLLGQVQEYQPGRPVARTGSHMTQVVEEKLAPITKRVKLRSINEVANVKSQYPDFLKLLSLNTDSGKRIRRIKHEQIHSVLSSTIDPPSTSNPYYYEYDGGFRILAGGEDFDDMIMTYVKIPDDIIYSFTVTIFGDILYDPNGNIDPEWRDQEINEIIFIQLGLIGINLKDADLVRVSQTAKMQGE